MRDYSAEFRRRNQLARERGFRNYWQQRTLGRQVESREDIRRLPVSANEARKQAVRVRYLARKERISDELAAERLAVPRSRLWWIKGKGARRDPIVLRPLVIRDEQGRPTVELVPVWGPRRIATADKVLDIEWREAQYGNATPEELAWLANTRLPGVEVIADPDELHDVARRAQFEDFGDSSGEVTS